LKPVTEYSLLVAMLIALGAALVHQAEALGITVDEPSHLLSAHLYWQGADRLAPRDMPPLIKIVGGWIPGLFGLPDMTTDPSWAQQHEWPISSAMLLRMRPAEIQPLIRAARLPFILFPLLTTALLWWWARQLFSPSTALTLAAIFACEPTSLGHGAFFKNDHAATFGYLLFWVLAWRYWLLPSTGRAAALGAAACVAILAKLSMLILPPIGLLILALRRASVKQFGAFAGTVYLGAAVACQFDPTLQLLRDGVRSIVDSSATANPVWLDGRVIEGGDRGYFPRALVYKLPLTLLFFSVCSLGYVLYRIAVKRLGFFAGRPAIVMALLAGAVYLTAASFNSIQFGVRLILPIWPYLLILGGLLLTALPPVFRPAFQIMLVGGVLFASVSTYPRGAAYFNGFSRTTRQAADKLADSNLDWGQDLPSLARYMEQEHVGYVKLAYFGNDLPSRWLPGARHELLALPWQPGFVKDATFKPSPGLYAISPNCLTGHFFPKGYRDYFARFRSKRPYGYAGSFLIYLIE
jgi:hypothetical protein